MKQLISNTRPAKGDGRSSDGSQPAADYDVLQAAYDHFNRDLFESRLPKVMLTISRRPMRLGQSARGYFRPAKFRHRGGSDCVHEISINPDHFKDVSDEDILSTLVHEMTHLWQKEFGRPSAGGHNKEWADKMEEIGLLPTDTGRPEGGKIGLNVTHCVIAGGRFEIAALRFVEQNQVGWQDLINRGCSHETIKLRLAKQHRFLRFKCPRCGQSAVASSWSRLECSLCRQIAFGSGEEAAANESAIPFIRELLKERDYEFAERIFLDCLTACGEYRMQAYPITAIFLTEIPDNEGPGKGIRLHAANWIIQLFRDLKHEDRRHLLEDLMQCEYPSVVMGQIVPVFGPSGSDPQAESIRSSMASYMGDPIQLAPYDSSQRPELDDRTQETRTS